MPGPHTHLYIPIGACLCAPHRWSVGPAVVRTAQCCLLFCRSCSWESLLFKEFSQASLKTKWLKALAPLIWHQTHLVLQPCSHPDYARLAMLWALCASGSYTAIRGRLVTAHKGHAPCFYPWLCGWLQGICRHRYLSVWRQGGAEINHELGWVGLFLQ